MPFTLTVEDGVARDVDRREISRRIRAMMRALQLKKEEASFVLTGDEQIRLLNARYRSKDRPTDVLAFALSEGDFAAFRGSMIGDVVVSVPTAIRQARTARRSSVEELTMLLAHGLLHLLGWDHETAAKDRAMRAEVERLCAAARKTPRFTQSKRASTPRAPKKKAET